MEQYRLARALALEFSHAAALHISTFLSRQNIRDMCAIDQCSACDKNRTCPPHCGTLAECVARLCDAPGEFWYRPWKN